MKPGEPRLCYSLDYSDPVEADAGLLRQLLPDVPLNAYLTFRLDFERLEAHPLLHEVAVKNMVAINRLEGLSHELVSVLFQICVTMVFCAKMKCLVLASCRLPSSRRAPRERV